MRGCSGIEPRGRVCARCGDDLSDRRVPHSALRPRPISVAAVNRRRRISRFCDRDAEDRRCCTEVPWNAISAMGGDPAVWNFVEDACDREPGLSIGYALRRRCGDTEGVLSEHRRDARRIRRLQIGRQRQPFSQPNICCRPARKCQDTHCAQPRSTPDNPAHVPAATTWSGVDGGEHSAILEYVLAAA